MTLIFSVAIACCVGTIFGHIIKELIFIGVNQVDKKIKATKKQIDKKMNALVKEDVKNDKKVERMKKGKC